MKIYVVGSSKNSFFELDNIREKFLVDEKHSGNNIDIVNPWYCELTGLYYLWKNDDNDIVGLEHYRRSFNLNESQINDILATHDIILHNCETHIAKKTPSIYRRLSTGWGYGSVKEVLMHYLMCTRYLHPDYYETAKLVLNNQWHYQYNMFICRRELLDQYMKWLMSIVTVYENQFGCKYAPLRSAGFVIEVFLSSLWVIHNKLKVHEHDVKQYNFKKIGYK